MALFSPGGPQVVDMLGKLFKHFDRDNDGVLNYQELRELQLATSDDDMSRKEFAQVLKTFGVPANSGLSLQHLKLTYSTGLSDLRSDYRKVFGDGSGGGGDSGGGGGRGGSSAPPASASDVKAAEAAAVAEATAALAARTRSFLSEALPVVATSSPAAVAALPISSAASAASFCSPSTDPPPTSAVDVNALDVAALVNAAPFEETRFRIPPAQCKRFNLRWRTALRAHFARAGAATEAELDDWLRTGLSNGRPLKLQVMALKPNSWFRVHAHPNIEFEQTLAGSLHEVRLKGDPPTKTFPEEEGGGDETAAGKEGKGAKAALKAAEGGGGGGGGGSSFMTAVKGPDLAAMQRSRKGGAFEWEAGSVPAGKYIANGVGSVHQSFTEEDGALIVVLYSGCHANIRPACCPTTGPGADLLRPGAGWAAADSP